jgi:hypothetical protein
MSIFLILWIVGYDLPAAADANAAGRDKMAPPVVPPHDDEDF